jgi:localization factor PodJL
MEWSLGDVPAKARDAALRSARDEGIPIGEWMTRQILEGFSELDAQGVQQSPDDVGERPTALPRRLNLTEPDHDTGALRDALSGILDGFLKLKTELEETAKQSATERSTLVADVEAFKTALADVRADSTRTSSNLQHQFAQTVGQLAIQISALTEGLAGLSSGKSEEQRQVDERLIQTQRHLEAMQDRQDENSKSVAGSLVSLAQWLEHTQAELRTTVQLIEQRVNGTENILQTLVSRNDDVSLKLNYRIAALEDRLQTTCDNFADAAHAQDGDMADIRKVVQDIGVRQEDASSSLTSQLQTLEADQVYLRGRTSAFQESLDSRCVVIQQDLANLDSRHRNSCEALTTSFEKLKDESSGNNAELTQKFSGEQAKLKEVVRQQNDAIIELKRHVSELCSETADHESSIAGRFSVINDTIENLSARFTSSSDTMADQLRETNCRLDTATSLAADTAEKLDNKVSSIELAFQESDVGHSQALRNALDTVNNVAARIDDSEARGAAIHIEHNQRFDDLGRELSTLRSSGELASSVLNDQLEQLAEKFERGQRQSDQVHESELNSLLSMLQQLDERHDAVERGFAQSLDGVRADTVGKLAALEPCLERLQRIVETGDREHDAARRSLEERVESLNGELKRAQCEFSNGSEGLDRRLVATQDKLSHLVERADNTTQTLIGMSQREAGTAELALGVEQRVAQLEEVLSGATSAKRTEEVVDRVVEAAVRENFGTSVKAITARLETLEATPNCGLSDSANSGPGAAEVSADAAASAPESVPLEEVFEPNAIAFVGDAAHPSSRSDLEAQSAEIDLGLTTSQEEQVHTVPKPSDSDVVQDTEQLELPPFPDPSPIVADIIAARESDVATAISERASVLPPVDLSAARRAAQAAAEQKQVAGHRGMLQSAWAENMKNFGKPSHVVAMVAAGVLVTSLAAGLWLSRSAAGARSNVASLAKVPEASASLQSSRIHQHAVNRRSSSTTAVPDAATALEASLHFKPSVGLTTGMPDGDVEKITALATSGDVHAELALGMRAFAEKGNPESATNAAKWLTMAAAHGDAVASYHLGLLYFEGRGVAVDQTRAIELYQAAAASGNRDAMNDLGVAYAQGNGVAKDYVQAARWFSNAAQVGLVEAQFDLAVLSERGNGVQQSLVDAYRWYVIAAKEGDGESRIRAEAIAAQLPAEDRAAADEAAARFKALPINPLSNTAPPR